MPHLDANALTSDPDGIEFLRGVLEVPVETSASRSAFDPFSRSRKRPQKRVDTEINRPRRAAAVTEAA